MFPAETFAHSDGVFPAGPSRTLAVAANGSLLTATVAFNPLVRDADGPEPHPVGEQLLAGMFICSATAKSDCADR